MFEDGLVESSSGLRKPPGKVASCPVVGVGASAGGLEAFQEFLAVAEPGDGLCYVLIQHLDPNHDSLLGELLGRRAKLDVVVVKSGMEVKADTIFLIPPGSEMTIENGLLQLDPFEEPRGLRRPIDEFFRTLAEDQRSNSACVVLSGTGSDGTHGLRAVKTAGGLTLVQDPDEAKYSGMPNSALATGLVDADMNARDMIAVLKRFFSGDEKMSFGDSGTGSQDYLREVLDIVGRRTGHDFSNYKKNTLLRRLQRRLQIVNVQDTAAYLRLLEQSESEPDELFSDMLINVTRFFRDPEHFNTLRTEVLGPMLDGRKTGEKVRVWCPGCSSGEEPYTIAMLLKEEATRRGINPEFQIFATDIDPPMIEIGRNAFYPSAVADDVPPELFDKYFVAERDGYRLDPTIRDMVRISQHNVIKDPPFSRLDLIVCRNVLIYFSSGLQQRLTRMMHHALKPGGHLFIGPSENLTDEHSLFERVNAEAHVFSRADKPSRYVGEAAQDPSLGRTRERGSRNRDGAANVSDDAVRDAVLARYTLPYVVVGRDGSISSTSGRTGAYIELSSGRPSLDLVANLREGLRSSVASMMKEVFGNAVSSSTQRLTTRNVSFLFDDRDRTVDVTVERMGTHQALVVFAERISGDDKPLEGTIEREEGSPNERVALLEQQLSDSRAQVRASVEQLETSNEELKSSNEEMMSMNEELQSSNEELTTINDELQDKIRQLASANSDIENFFTGVRVPVVFLASDGTIRNFTPEAKTIFSFVDTDHGRALSDIAATVDVAPIIDATRRVLTERSAEELAIASLTGDFHYLARVLPYKTPMGEIDGTVVTFTDVTEITDVSEALDVAKSDLQRHFDEIEQLYDAAPVGMVLFDTDGKYLRINSKLETIHGRPSEQDVGSDIDDVEPDFSEMVRGYVRTVVDTGQSVEGEDVRYDAGDGSGELVLRAYYYPLFDGKSVYAVGAIIIDMTEARQMEVELRRILNELQHRVKNMLANVLTLVRQAARSGESKAVTMETLTRRLTSLALTHDMLTQSDWRSAELHDIADAELVQVYGEERVTLKGPRVTLGPRAALSIGMTLHELATNALKHGGLKGDDGHVELTWLKQDAGDGEQLRLEWRERPTATETDWVSVGQTPGFGMRLIRSSIEGALGGTVKFENEKDGLHVTLSAAASRLAPDGGELLK